MEILNVNLPEEIVVCENISENDTDKLAYTVKGKDD